MPQTALQSSRQPSKLQKISRAALERDILPHVFKPGRYLGLEQGAFRKSFEHATVTMAVAFPDLYEIGFSNYGLKLLYSLVNRTKNYMCDRVYAPAPDFKAKLKSHNTPLFSVESLMPLLAFDVLAFSLQYELNYTTILGLLDSAQIPFRASNRTDAMPLLIAGGPGSANPMPLSPFFDAFIIGDGEEVLLEILAVVETGKQKRWSRVAVLTALSKLEGLYVPGISTKGYKRIVNIAENPVELAPLIPIIGAVHDRITVEARRGCDRMCRFCQPCFINLPVREQTIETIKSAALKEIEKTGYEECSLLSLSIADYSYFKPLILEVAETLKQENVSLSLPSQRADRFSIDVAEAVQSIRKSSLTFAPEAGTTRLRDVINKNLSDAEILSAVTNAYRSGWNKVKLYFMIGLPTETHADLDGIIDMVKRLQAACKSIQRDKSLSIKKALEVNITLSNFVPKPHTPFQWFPQDTMEQLYHKIDYLRKQSRGLHGVKLNFTDPEISKLEAVISKAGPELADVIEAAYNTGAYLDAWDDHKNFDRWFEALKAHNINYEAYTRDRCCSVESQLPWDCIDVGLDKKWLEKEYRRATKETSTTPCFEECSVCGVCASYGTWPQFIETPVFKAVKNSQSEIRLTDVAEPGSDTATTRKDRLPVVKARLKIEKRGNLRFISHLDWLRMIYRAVSRSKLPVAYSQGFNPKPKISFSPALPLFTESHGEYVDIELLRPVDNLRQQLNPYLSKLAQCVEEKLLPLSAPSIDKSICQISYTANSIIDRTCADPDTQGNIIERVSFLRTQSALPVLIPSKSNRKTSKQNKNSGATKSDNGANQSTASYQVLDLANYLSHFSVNPANGKVSFQFILPETTGPYVSSQSNKSTFHGKSETTPMNQKHFGLSGNNIESLPVFHFDANGKHNDTQSIEIKAFNPGDRGVIAIKPTWLLNLINPEVTWTVTRASIQLSDPGLPTAKETISNARESNTVVNCL
ncbi:MAG: TIGR03936 family radical SAM-associated protein [Cyanobacteria bacterium P01_H01_bin.74]